jgi:predicted nucleic acid-binding protein
MRPVFADTSYYVALLGPSDKHHKLALKWSQRLLGRVVETEHILVELGNALSGREDRHLYVPFVEELLKDPGTVLFLLPRRFSVRVCACSLNVPIKNGLLSIAFRFSS